MNGARRRSSTERPIWGAGHTMTIQHRNRTERRIFLDSSRARRNTERDAISSVTRIQKPNLARVPAMSRVRVAARRLRALPSSRRSACDRAGHQLGGGHSDGSDRGDRRPRTDRVRAAHRCHVAQLALPARCCRSAVDRLDYWPTPQRRDCLARVARPDRTGDRDRDRSIGGAQRRVA